MSVRYRIELIGLYKKKTPRASKGWVSGNIKYQPENSGTVSVKSLSSLLMSFVMYVHDKACFG